MESSIECPSCKKVFQTVTHDTFAVTCPYCRVLFERRSRSVLRIQTDASAEPLIKNGAQATLQDLFFRAVGWIHYRGTDDGESFTWFEWHLKHEQDSYWLEEDSDTGDFKLYREVHLPSPIPLESLRVGGTLDLDGQSFKIREINTAQAVEYAGELDWQPGRGEHLSYVDGDRGSAVCSLEDAGEDQQAYVGKILSRKLVLEAFGVKYAPKSRGTPARMFWISLVTTSILGIIVSGVSGYTQHKRIQQQREACQSVPDPAQCIEELESSLRHTNSPVHVFRSGSTSFGK